MKKILLVLMLVACFASTAYGITYDQANYDKHIGDALTKGQNDPVRNFIGEMETIAAGGEKGTGSFFYVDSAVLSAGAGGSWTAALATLQEAIDDCTDNAGDIIYVAQGHAEDLATAAVLLFDCPGITVIGFGSGDEMPEFSLTAQASTVSVTAADVTIYNLRFLGEWAGGSTLGIDVQTTGDGFRVLGCEFRSNSSNEELLIALNVTTNAHNLVIAGNSFVFETGGGESSAIVFEAISNKTVISGNYFNGDWSDYVILGTGGISLQMLVEGNVIHNIDGSSGGKLISFNASTTGDIIGNTCYGVGSAQAIVANSMFVSPDNVTMTTEDVETRTYEAMMGSFTGASGAAQGASIYADMVLAQTDLDDILANMITYGLDHLITALDGSTNAYPTSVASHSILAYLMDNSADPATVNYDNTLHSFKAIGTDTDTLITNVAAIATSIAAMNDTGWIGTCSANVGGTDEAVVPLLSGFGDDFFNTGWSLLCIYDSDGHGSAPEGEMRDITDYTSSDGTFVVNVAFTAALTTGDVVMVKRTEELELDMPTMLGGAGTIWYVDSGATNGDATGLTWENAHLTIQDADDDLSAGDVVYLADGHDETVATGDSTLLNVANTSFIGMGKGDARPLITISDDGTLLTLNAAGITFKNIRLQSSVTACDIAISVGASGIGCTIEDCAFIDGDATTTDEFVDVISVNAAASNLTVKNCTYYSLDATGHTNSFIDLGATTIDSPSIIGCTIFGMFAEAPIWGGASAVPVNVLIKDNVISNTTTGEHCIEFTGAATGVCTGNRLYSNDYATMLDPGSMKCIDNWGTDAINQQSIAIPISAETSDVGEVAAGSNLERLEWLQKQADDICATLGIDSTDDNVFYVRSGESGADDGTNWTDAEATLALGIGEVTTATGAYIFVASNHAENIGGDTAINKAGMTIWGLGVGEARPKLTFDTSSDVLTHTVPNVKYKNIIFICSTQDTTVGITLDGASDGAVFEDCEWRNTTTSEFVSCVTFTAAACDDVRFTRCKFINRTATHAATAAITNIVDVTDNMTIEDCEFYGDWTLAAIWSDDADTNVKVLNNIVQNHSTGVHAIEFSAAALGTLAGNKCYADTWGVVIDPGSLKCYNNYVSNAINESGHLFPDAPVDIDPGIQGTGRIIYVDSGATAGGGATWATAYNTVDDAMDDTLADRGDIIYVAQYHAEREEATGPIFTMDVDGVSVIGVSQGTPHGVVTTGVPANGDCQMPLFVLDHVDAEVSITAANCRIQGIRIESDLEDVKIGLLIAGTGDGSVVEGCYFSDGAVTEELLVGIQATADADTIQLLNNRFSTVASGGCTHGILMAGGCDNAVVQGNIIQGTYSTGAFIATAAPSVNLQILDNIFTNQGAVAMDLNATTTGILARNFFAGTTSMAAAVTDIDQMWCFENYTTGADNASAVIDPAVDSE